MARKSVIGAPAGRPYPQTNGWTFWMYSDGDSGDLREIDLLRAGKVEQQVERPLPPVEGQVELLRLADRPFLEILVHDPQNINSWWPCEDAATFYWG